MSAVSSRRYSANSDSMDRIAIIGIARNFSTQPRIRNEMEVFSAKYLIDGYGKVTVDGVTDFFQFERPASLLRKLVYFLGGFFPLFRIRFENFLYRRYSKKIKTKGYRFVIPHQIEDGLVALASGVPFLFHSNEYLPRQFDGNRLFRFTEIRYRHLALQSILSNAVLTIVEGDTVARQYASVYGISADRFIVMPSMPSYRKSFNNSFVSHSTINLVHHGALFPERGLELLMDVASTLGSGYHLTLMGPVPSHYVKALNKRAKKAGNIEILAPVPYEQIVETLHGYDLGLVIFGSPHFHHKYMTVPNKFWECLQARVPVLVSPESAMAEYVRESGCGLVATSASLDGYVTAIRSLSRQDIAALKARCEEKAWIHSRDSWLSTYAARIDRAVDAAYKRRAEEAPK